MSRRPLAHLLPASAAQLRAAPPAGGVLAPAPATLRFVPAATPARPANPARPRLTPGRFYLGLAGLALGLAALSLLAPSTPSYDPWSWTLWAREIIHGQLVITATGTSWKPLPMLFTIPFALLGSAAPDLWLVVARAGAIAAVLMAFRLAYRLTLQVALAGERRSRSSLSVQGPAVLAGLLALVALGFSAKGGYITASGLGYSEALATALLLIAIECHLDGRHRAAFLVGFLLALDRPEIWLFWIPYGLWLGRRDPAMRVVIATAFALQPIAWFLPVYLGSGHLGSSVTRAQNPRANSLAYASNPFLAELGRAAWPSMMLRVKIMAGLVMLGLPVWRWRAGRSRGAVPPRMSTAATLGLGGVAWFTVIALMTQLGFSGNDRYLVLGASLIDVCAAVGFGWLAVHLGRATRAPAALGVTLAAAAFALLPGWIGRQDFVSLPKLHGALLYQARLRQDLSQAIALGGGRRHVLACGRVMAEGFQVPMVAYALDVPTPRVLAPPATGATAGPAPNVILQTRATRSSTQLPIVRTWRRVRYTYRGSAGPWNTFTHCTTGS